MPILLPKPDPLFSHASLSTLLRDQIHKMENAIDELSDDTFLQNSPDDMIEVISANVHVPPLTLEPAVSHTPSEIRNTVVFPLTSPIDGFRFSVDVPHTGASGLFNHQPDTHDLDKPTARLNSNNMRGSITINRIVVGDVSPDELRASFETEIDKVRKYIAWQGVQLDPFNNSLKDEASKIVHGRRDRLLKARHIAASLGYSLPHRQGAPPTYISPAVRRKIPQIVTTATGTFQPEPTIAEAEYQNILSIIENMSFVMERNPRVFSSAPEETIRDHYLVQLNGQYEGTATGETFNGVGHTDILVRDGSTNLFVAEWRRADARRFWAARRSFTRHYPDGYYRPDSEVALGEEADKATTAIGWNAIVASKFHPNRHTPRLKPSRLSRRLLLDFRIELCAHQYDDGRELNPRHQPDDGADHHQNGLTQRNQIEVDAPAPGDFSHRSCASNTAVASFGETVFLSERSMTSAGLTVAHLIEAELAR